jgi:hypothetical protein
MTTEEDFSSRMVNILNYGALNVAIGLGYKAGLFEALDAADKPLTPGELAAQAGNLNARVVREISATETSRRLSLPAGRKQQPRQLLPRDSDPDKLRLQ